jgi:hypothetical protein
MEFVDLLPSLTAPFPSSAAYVVLFSDYLDEM